MASAWKLICPEHNTELTAEKTIPISREGVVTKYPLFYCEDCGCYYFHADASLQNSTFEYGKHEVKYCENEPYETTTERITHEDLSNKFGGGQYRILICRHRTIGTQKKCE